MIRRATRLSQSSAALKDNIWSNDRKILNTGKIRKKVTDHYILFVTRGDKFSAISAQYEQIT